MRCRIEELRFKEVIDIGDGTRYGFAGDLEIDSDSGAILSVIVPGRPRGFGLLGRGEDLVFPWEAVRRFGEDVILVEGKRRRECRRE